MSIVQSVSLRKQLTYKLYSKQALLSS